jgi:hypothetical protein
MVSFNELKNMSCEEVINYLYKLRLTQKYEFLYMITDAYIENICYDMIEEVDKRLGKDLRDNPRKTNYAYAAEKNQGIEITINIDFVHVENQIYPINENFFSEADKLIDFWFKNWRKIKNK